MFSEVINALFFTYLATEYSGSNNYGRSKHEDSGIVLLPKLILRHDVRRIGIVTMIVIVVNAFDSLSGIGSLMHTFLDALLLYHIPKISLVIIFYITTLYFDCRYTIRYHQRLPQPFSFCHDFLPRVVRLFIRIFPVYPIMAVVISFGFLFIISIFELLHIPTNILNLPIYYGTLYGPFSYIYYHVKRDFVIESGTGSIMTLPRHHIPIIKFESTHC